MFPPPQPWKALVPADPEQLYLAFSSRFAMRSIRRIPAFLKYSKQIMRQIEAADGAVGYSLGLDLPRRHFYTLSAWEDEAHLRQFVGSLAHADVMEEFREDMRAPSVFVSWRALGAELPLTWNEALARQSQRDPGQRPHSSGEDSGGPHTVR